MPFKFGVDSSGNYGYIKAGADSVTPFLTRTGNATVAQVLSGYTFSNTSSSGLTGTMPHLTNRTTITHASNNQTKVILADEAFTTTNSDGVARFELRYNGDSGYITPNTLLALPCYKVANCIGLTAAKIVKGNSILGLAGTATLQPTSFKTILESNKSSWDTSRTISGFGVGKIVVITAYMISTGSDRYIRINGGMTSWKTSCIMAADLRYYTFIGIANSTSISFTIFGEHMFQLAGYFM